MFVFHTTESFRHHVFSSVHKQEDAAKYLQKILNKVTPEISKIFQGRMAQTTICINPAKEHEPLKQVKTFFTLSISLDSEPPVHMQKCFDSYFAPIIMCGEDQEVYCKSCEMMMKTKIISSLQEVPSVLVLHLERFEFDYDTMCYVKNYSSVQIPLQLSVKEEAGVNHTYDLYAIVNHSGSLNGGHYYADIKDENGWYRFDDSVVYRLEMYIPSDEAYLLLYKKCSKSTQDTFFVVSETESPRKQRKRANTLPEDHLKSVKIRRCSERDSQSTVINEQNHLNNSDSNSETEAHASQTMPIEPGLDRESIDADQNQPTTNDSSGEIDCQFSESECKKAKDQQDLQFLQKNSDSNSETEAHTSQTMPIEPGPDRESIDADRNQPTTNDSSGKMDCQFSKSECEKAKDQQDLQFLQNNSDSNAETESNTSQNMADEPTLEMQSNDDNGDNDNQLKLLPSSAGQVSTRRALMKYYFGIPLSLLVFLILFLLIIIIVIIAHLTY
uniref:USP domain-containing protein n=1 Tax=Cyprinus carpio TaxID=7962 RepID=A0A8C1IQ05_CYPCA